VSEDLYARGWVDGYNQALIDLAAEQDRIHDAAARVQLGRIISALRRGVGARVAVGKMDEALCTRGWVNGSNQALIDVAAEQDRVLDAAARVQLQRLIEKLRYQTGTGIVG
jgi:hypothetical protein